MEPSAIQELYDHRRFEYFLLESAQSARKSLGAPMTPDDDVVIYLAHQLYLASDPVFLDPSARQTLFACPTDLSHFFDEHPNLPEAYRAAAYSVNANARLIAIVVFRKESLFRPHASKTPRKHHLGHAKIFYGFASDLYGRRQQPSSYRTLAEIHRKLANAFELYVRLLDRIRVDYLHLLEHLSSGTIYHLSREMRETAQTVERNRLIDDYLEAISEEKRSPCAKNKQRLQSSEEAARKFGVL